MLHATLKQTTQVYDVFTSTRIVNRHFEFEFVFNCRGKLCKYHYEHVFSTKYPGVAMDDKYYMITAKGCESQWNKEKCTLSIGEVSVCVPYMLRKNNIRRYTYQHMSELLDVYAEMRKQEYDDLMETQFSCRY